MNRIEQINKELKQIRECLKAERFFLGLVYNDSESTNAFKKYIELLDGCKILDSSIECIETLKEYKQKLIRERAVLRTQENRVMFQKWLDKPNYKKLIKVLSKYGKNQTEAFNRFVNEL